MTREEVSVLREHITVRMKETTPQMLIDQSGRAKLLKRSTTLSLLYYGWAVPVLIDVEDTKNSVALYLLVSSGGFYIPYYLTKSISVSQSEADLCWYGGTRGMLHGSALNVLINHNNTNSRNTAGFVMMGSISEAIAGYYVAKKTHITDGTAAAIGLGGDFGITWGFEIPFLFNKDEDERFTAGSVLFGSGVGFCVGRRLAAQQNYTTGDVGIVKAAGILGAGVGTSLIVIAGSEKSEAYASAALLASSIGLGMGHYLIANKDYTSGQGTLVLLSEIAGGLFGAGVAYLISPETGKEKIYAASSSLGAAAGFWGMYHSIRQNPEKEKSHYSLHYSVNPGCFVLLTSPLRNRVSTHTTVPLFNITVNY